VSLRTRLALVFVAATLIPLGATVWLTTLLLNQSLRLSPVDQISELSRSLETTGKEYFQQACSQLKADALAGRAAPVVAPNANELLSSEDSERCAVMGDAGDRLLFLARTPHGVSVWERPLDIRMQDLRRQYTEARRTVNALGILRRGSFPAWILLAAGIWLIALTLVWLVATRFSRPIVKLTQRDRIDSGPSTAKAARVAGASVVNRGPSR